MQIILYNHLRHAIFFLFLSTYISAFDIWVTVAVYACVHVCTRAWCVFLSLTLGSVLESPSRLDEEHRLIARYAARLAAEAGNSTVSMRPHGGHQSPCISDLMLWSFCQVFFISTGNLDFETEMWAFIFHDLYLF